MRTVPGRVQKIMEVSISSACVPYFCSRTASSAALPISTSEKCITIPLLRQQLGVAFSGQAVETPVLRT